MFIVLIIGKKLQILFSRLVWFSKFIVSSPANIRLGQDVLKTFWRLLARRLEDVLGRRIANTSWRRLGKREMFAGKPFVKI